jgi:hypothetical protein
MHANDDVEPMSLFLSFWRMGFFRRMHTNLIMISKITISANLSFAWFQLVLVEWVIEAENRLVVLVVVMLESMDLLVVV